MVEQQQWSGVSLGQALEIAAGRLPREFQNWEEVPGELGRLAREQLLPTPVVTDSYGTRNRTSGRQPDSTHHDGLTLTDAIWETQGRQTDTRGRLLPTPRAQDGQRHNAPTEYELGREQGKDLLHVRLGRLPLLPTPGANDATGGEGPTRQARQETGETGGPSLRDIGHLLPTPRAADGGLTDSRGSLLPTPTSSGKRAPDYNQQARGGGGDDLQTAAHRLQPPGASTSPRSAAGNTCSDGPHPGQLTIGDA
jgi:hypothetical protein